MNFNRDSVRGKAWPQTFLRSRSHPLISDSLYEVFSTLRFPLAVYPEVVALLPLFQMLGLPLSQYKVANS
ncbi:hypothetical protein LEP1GSC077_0028 [Leptospira interrogans str. C10069]|nr:hypothetical protein LEP1GSC077_0028 [Leptospira interrogans str. C10069]